MSENEIGRRRAPRLAAVTILAGLAALALAHARADGTRTILIGVYTLAEYAAHGDRPIGRIAYDEAGRMWAMLTPPGRAPVSSESSPEEYRAAMRGLIAYYGRYEVDEAAGQVVHHVEAASNPAWIGSEFVRWYRLEGERLTLSLNPEFNNALVWQRLPSADGAASRALSPDRARSP